MLGTSAYKPAKLDLSPSPELKRGWIHSGGHWWYVPAKGKGSPLVYGVVPGAPCSGGLVAGPTYSTRAALPPTGQ